MIAAGIFGSTDKLELIEGELIAMVPTGPEHAHIVAQLLRILMTCSTRLVRVQSPITLPNHSEPEPDIALVTPKSYMTGHPLPEDIQLIIEVSDTSLIKDKQIKLPLYARYKLPEVWIVDIKAHAIECYWQPEEGGYQKTSRFVDGILTSPTQPGLDIDLDSLW
jgi:Uma2 family endonuclease